ncbi:MAG: hypothetical protein MI861_26440 [Pirellulales bacterium]|nr:hypothetical protein [Pirellulales bacterium]
MFQRCVIFVTLVAVATGFASADTPSLLRIFGKKNRLGSNTPASYELTKEDGPWLILASTFVGQNAKQRATRLAEEIRRDMKLPAYIYREQFDFTKSLKSRNPQAPNMRYANGYRYEAYAVLVGEYDSVEHRGLERDLEKIRTAVPKVFRDRNEMAAEINLNTPATMINAIKSKWWRSGQDKKRGPMYSAFVTRNPLLPEEYFAAPTVDSFVHQLNNGNEFSLLDCKGNYTVVVRTFEGLETVVDGRSEKKFLPSMRRLDKFAQDAGKMTMKLRADGEEAYQFHDRFRSLVTVGSFDNLGRRLPDGRFEYAPEIRRVMERYSAFNAQVARAIPGQRGVAANHAAMIPFDVQPTPIAVPKVSKRSLYSSFGRR